MAAATILNFEKCQNLWIEGVSPDLADRCITTTWRWSHEQKMEPEVNSRDVIRLSAYMCLIALPTNIHLVSEIR